MKLTLKAANFWSLITISLPNILSYFPLNPIMIVNTPTLFTSSWSLDNKYFHLLLYNHMNVKHKQLYKSLEQGWNFCWSVDNKAKSERITELYVNTRTLYVYIGMCEKYFNKCFNTKRSVEGTKSMWNV